MSTLIGRCAGLFAVIFWYGRCISQVSVIYVSACYPVVSLIIKVECSNAYSSFGIFVFALVCLKSIIEAMAVIGAQSHAQAGNGIVVYTHGYCIIVGRSELKRGARTIFYPLVFWKMHWIEGRNQHGFISPVTSPNTYTGFVPCAWHDCVLSLGAVYSEEFVRKVMGIGIPHRNYNMSGTDIELRTEWFLYPELFQGNFTATFYLFFPFAHFFLFHFYGRLCSTVFKLNFASHCPAFAEIISYHDDYMRKIELSMTFGIFIIFRFRVAVDIVTVEVARHYSFTIASQCKLWLLGSILSRCFFCAVAFFVFVNAVFGI